VGGELRYYLVLNKELDFETQDLHSVTIEVTDSGGVTHEKSFDVHVLDAVETGDAARGAITRRRADPEGQPFRSSNTTERSGGIATLPDLHSLMGPNRQYCGPCLAEDLIQRCTQSH
jgi:hypothetical protein